MMEPEPIDLNIVRSSVRLVRMTTRHPRVFLAIAAISVFWSIGAVLFIQFRRLPTCSAPARASPACSW
jgi:hypothetical protein